MTTHLIATEPAFLDRPTQSETAITINRLAVCEGPSTHPTEEEMKCRRPESLPGCSIHQSEEEMRLSLSDAAEENHTLKLAERKEWIKGKRLAAYKSYQKKLRVHLYRRKTLMNMLGPLGMIMDQEERNKYFKTEVEELRALRKASGEQFLNERHAVQDNAQELKEETRERLLNLVDGEGEIATGLKKRLDEIDEWETREGQEYKAELMKLHKEWEASKKAIRIKGELLDALSRYSKGDLINNLSSN
ncbi:8a1c3329-d78d-490c-9bae-c921b81eea37 [Sclerotinia trifoliorum]|uniref:8a1c3329-d78d-490c-9bae-c921b81eea37 n=1 Tax=Sclerotinia trifoliorum TaxID=28548 RepID=A0A8H2VQW4_9HELO|nr:8a1c3329-d78d-490c-9bae-c921b81eea37 [Sclerotinia trifoliorum]